MSVMEDILSVMEQTREKEWQAYLVRLALRRELHLIHDDEQVLHDLYVSGELQMEEVDLIVARQATIEDFLRDTSVLSYGCILCRDTGCEFCGEDG